MGSFPLFRCFPLAQDIGGEQALRQYFRTYGELAKKLNVGLILETATWRGNRDWGEKLGYSTEDLAAVNSEAVRLLQEIRSEYDTDRTPIVISGCIGPRGDGYIPDTAMSAIEAEAYHQIQIQTFANTAQLIWLPRSP